MGVHFTDQFSLLHFASGIIAFFWEISLIKWFILHIVYELFTNTHFGINFINKYTFWPGGKLNFDTTVNIIGELNDLFAHELEHYRQNYTGELETYDDENPKSLDYYTRPIELKAQVKGFNRLAKLQKRPFESVVKQWFETHKDIHNLNPKEQEFVISSILDLKKQVR